MNRKNLHIPTLVLDWANNICFNVGKLTSIDNNLRKNEKYRGVENVVFHTQ